MNSLKSSLIIISEESSRERSFLETTGESYGRGELKRLFKVIHTEWFQQERKKVMKKIASKNRKERKKRKRKMEKERQRRKN
jgi:hypothetical protein